MEEERKILEEKLYKVLTRHDKMNISFEDPSNLNLESTVILKNRTLFDLPSYDMLKRIFCKQLLAKKQGNLSFCFTLKESL